VTRHHIDSRVDGGHQLVSRRLRGKSHPSPVQVVDESAVDQIVAVFGQVGLVSVEEEPEETIPVGIHPTVFNRYITVWEPYLTFQTCFRTEEPRLQPNVIPIKVSPIQQLKG